MLQREQQNTNINSPDDNLRAKSYKTHEGEYYYESIDSTKSGSYTPKAERN